MNRRTLPVGCRSLFEKDKLLFAFGVAAGLQVDARRMDPADLRFLLTGGVAVGELPVPNPCPTWLSDKSWGEICRASKLPDPLWQVSPSLPHKVLFGLSLFLWYCVSRIVMHACMFQARSSSTSTPGKRTGSFMFLAVLHTSFSLPCAGFARLHCSQQCFLEEDLRQPGA